jgi:hypothetical protein
MYSNETQNEIEKRFFTDTTRLALCPLKGKERRAFPHFREEDILLKESSRNGLMSDLSVRIRAICLPGHDDR